MTTAAACGTVSTSHAAPAACARRSTAVRRWLCALSVWLAVFLSTSVAAAVIVREPGSLFGALGLDLRADDQIEAVSAGDMVWRDVNNPLQLMAVEFNRAGIERLRVRVRRGAQTHTVELPLERWSWRLDLAQRAPDDGAPRAASVLAAEVTALAGAAEVLAWIALDQAERLATAKRWSEAEQAYAQALALTRSHALDVLARRALRLDAAFPDKARAVAVAAAYVTASRRPPQNRWRLAGALNLLGRAEMNLWKGKEALAHFDEAIAVLGGADAASVETVRALQNRAAVNFRSLQRDDLARQDLHAARALLLQLSPRSPMFAGIDGTLGALLSRSDAAQAVMLTEQAVDVMQRFTPDSPDLARMQANVGLYQRGRRRLGDAELWLQRAIASFTRVAPGSAEIGIAQGWLAGVLLERGDYRHAREAAQAAIASTQAVEPDGYAHLAALGSLAAIELEMGQVQAAIERLDHVVAVASDANNMQRSRALGLRGIALATAGQSAPALAALDEALAAFARAGLQEYFVAEMFIAQARARRASGAVDAAATSLDQAMAIVQRFAPLTSQQGFVHFERARLHRAAAQLAPALAEYKHGFDCLEAHRDLIGGNEDSRARWHARFAAFYREALETALELQQDDEAWLLLERYRAQEFLALLGARRAALRASLPEKLRQALQTLGDDFAAQLERVVTTTAPALDQRYRALLARLTAAEPRWSSLTDTTIATRSASAAALPAATTLVSYAVLADHSVAFTVSAQRVRVVRLDIGAEALRQQVDRLRLLLTAPASNAQDLAALRSRAAALYQLLIAPVQEELQGSERLYVVADGPLHWLPFSALMAPAGRQGSARYLVEEVAISHVVSATAWLATRTPERVQAEATIGVVAAPQFSGTATTTTQRGVAQALPGAAAEAQAIAAIFGTRVSLHLGSAATVAAAMQMLQQKVMVHFATHAILDADDPLASRLHLASDGSDVDSLSAWDVMHAAGIRADLVTLSACESALGANSAGEGLVGLTRAFQFAGVRSVLASLWRVSDLATAQLMQTFYAELARGTPRDLALARAQRRLIQSAPPFWQRWLGRGRDLSHPYFWSAFVLAGAPQ